MGYKNHVIPQSEHVFVAGGTGSGKTTLAQAYIAGYEYVAFLDTKGVEGFGDFVPDEEIQIVERLEQLPFVEKKKIIYRPEPSEMNLEYYNAFYQWCYDRRNTTVVTDELMSVCPNPMVIPEGLKAILTRGRKFNVQSFALTQRPSGVPQLCMSESSHFFVGRLNLPQDRKKLVEITGQPALYEKAEKYHFWYYDVNQDDPAYITLKM